MKLTLRFTVLLACVLGLAACQSSQRKQDDTERPYQRKIYLTEQDYLDDLSERAQAERREAKPNVESDYIFNLQPETEKHVYFFDDRTRPMVPDQASERDYKNTKRLWQKPKRYSPEEYYNGQPAAAESTPAASSTSNYYEDEYDY